MEVKHSNICKTCLSNSLLARLDEMSVKRDESRSYIIREAVRLYLKVHTPDPNAVNE